MTTESIHIDSFIGELTIQDYENLRRSLKAFLESRDANTPEDKLKVIQELVPQLEQVFALNPGVQQMLNKRAKGSGQSISEALKFSREDLASALAPKTGGEVKRRVVPRIKGRFLIWALELYGFSARYSKGSESEHHVLIDALFSGKYTQPHIREGTYRIIRRSFNSSTPHHANVIKMYVRKVGVMDSYVKERDEYLPAPIYRYWTIDAYLQRSSKEGEGEGQTRIRSSSGWISNYQEQTLFLGCVTYSHIDELERDEHEIPPYDDYPEIMLVHQHGGDHRVIRGLTLAHFPYLGLPVCTSVVIELIDNDVSFDPAELPEICRHELSNDIVEHAGLPLELPEYGHYLIENLPPHMKEFVTNRLETKYSMMLTP